MPRVAIKHRRQALELYAGAVRELELVAGHNMQEFRDGVYVRRAAERLVQFGVDLACELGVTVLDREHARVPEGYEETFRELGRVGVIPSPLAEKMVAAAALRRRVVFGWPPQPGEDDSGPADPYEALHRRLPFLAILLREYGRHLEPLVRRS